MNKTLTWIIVVVVIIIGGVLLFTGDNPEPAQAPEDAMMQDEGENMMDDGENMMEEDGAMMEGEEGAMMEDDGAAMESRTVVEVSYTNSGFLPSPVTISAGDTVTFVNNSSREVWPASAVHPTHTVYPGSDIQKCGTAEEDSIFDSCGGVAPGDTYSFTFTETGEWGYHNHLQAGETGQIIVQ